MTYGVFSVDPRGTRVAEPMACPSFEGEGADTWGTTRMNRSFLVFAPYLTLAGCSSGDTPVASAEMTDTAVNAVERRDPPSLPASGPAFSVRLEVDVAITHPDVDFISVCLPHREDPYAPDFDSCLVSTRLDGGRISGELLVATDISRLFTVIWDAASPDDPSISSFEIGPGADAIALM